mmetsp:Transcript_62685/g.137917  ORF Transcript_62685/g.137917 Transcript_62685/m.137917 type:complete len:94 (-) Transcript_62685:221-502(-)
MRAACGGAPLEAPGHVPSQPRGRMLGQLVIHRHWGVAPRRLAGTCTGLVRELVTSLLRRWCSCSLPQEGAAVELAGGRHITLGAQSLGALARP